MDANNLLMGGGVKSAAFPNGQFGTRVGGRILRAPTVRQQNDFDTGKPKFWDNGDPMMQIVVNVATDLRDPQDPNDDGERAIYVKAQMQQAVRDAVRGARANGLEVGGLLFITYVRDEPNSRGRGNPKKVYSAEYAPPAAAAANDALMGGNGNGQPAPQQSQAFAPVQQEQVRPSGVDPELWAQLSVEQRQSVLAASAGVR